MRNRTLNIKTKITSSHKLKLYPQQKNNLIILQYYFSSQYSFSTDTTDGKINSNYDCLAECKTTQKTDSVFTAALPLS